MEFFSSVHRDEKTLVVRCPMLNTKKRPEKRPVLREHQVTRTVKLADFASRRCTGKNFTS